MTISAATRTIAQSSAILAAAEAAQCEWLGGNDAIRQSACGLRDALDTWNGLASGWIHPATAYPELARWWPDDAQGRALEQAEREVSDWAGALVITVREKSGLDLGAELVTTGGTS